MMRKVLGVVFALSFVGVVFVAPVRADEWDKKTVVTFNHPVEIAGHVLLAGKYVFQLADSNTNRHIVQIFSGDGQTIIATVLAIPNYRLTTTDDTVMTFNEAATGTPQAVRAWFYPGSNIGQEFVYPKPRAIELAKATNVVVPALANDGPIDVTSVDALKRAPIVAISPDATEAPVATNPTTAADNLSSPAGSRPGAAGRARLPKTASQLPTIILFGLGSILVACGAFALTRRAPAAIM
jgi:hypothetical protein